MSKNFKSLALIISSGLLLSLPCYSQNIFQAKPKESAADSILNSTVSNNPNSKTAKIICAKVYVKNGKYLEAEQLLMQVLEEDPSNEKANKLLKELNKKFSNDILMESTEEQEKAADTPIQIEPLRSSDSSIENLNKPAPSISVTKTEKSKPVQEKTIKLPTKEEILKRAKARKQAEEKASEESNSPLAIQAPNISSKATQIINKQEENKSEDFIEPITIAPKVSEEENLSDNSELPEKKTLIYPMHR